MNASFWRRIHFWAAIAWMFPGVLVAYVIVYHMPDPHASFAILVVSLYANFVSHLGAYQAARAEGAADVKSTD